MMAAEVLRFGLAGAVNTALGFAFRRLGARRPTTAYFVLKARVFQDTQP